jgi:hypothetical protein
MPFRLGVDAISANKTAITGDFRQNRQHFGPQSPPGPIFWTDQGQLDDQILTRQRQFDMLTTAGTNW